MWAVLKVSSHILDFFSKFLRVFKKTNGNGNVSNIVIKRRRAISTSPEITFTVCLFAPQITLYLGKRDFVDHVDSVEVVGMSCCVHALKQGSCVWTDATVFASRVQRAPSKWTLRALTAGKVPGGKRLWSPWPQAGTLKVSPSLQFTSTSPAPSATEVKTWTWWVCPSGETSGSSASRFTRPRETTRLKPRCRNSSWGRSESRDTRFPFRSANTTFLAVLHLSSFACQSFFLSFLLDADRSALFRLPAARAQRFWQGALTCPTCVVHTHLDCLTV